MGELANAVDHIRGVVSLHEARKEIAKLDARCKELDKANLGLAMESNRLRKRIATLEREFVCIGWITRESIRRLRRGGNGSRGTVPIHDRLSVTASIPIYIERDCAKLYKDKRA